MDMEQFVGTTQAGINTISDAEYWTTIDDDDDGIMTDDITPEMLRDGDIETMRWWLDDCTLPDGYEASKLDAYEIIRMVTNSYDGGIARFLADGAGE